MLMERDLCDIYFFFDQHFLMDYISEWLKMQIAVLEEQKREDAEKADDEAKPSDADLSAAEPTMRTNGFDQKPDINDVPMEENQVPCHN